MGSDPSKSHAVTADRPVDGVAIRVRGQVQGVGFRPFVWQLAHSHGVRGEVPNDPEGVLIRAIGVTEAFLYAIRREASAVARVDALDLAPHGFDVAPVGSVIAASGGVGARTRVTPDAATCPACPAGIRDADDRRHG